MCLWEALPRIISLVFVEFICMLFGSDQVSNWSKRVCMFDVEELEPIISDNVVSSTWMCMTKETGSRSDPCGMPPFKGNHREHGRPVTHTHWWRWYKKDSNHLHSCLGTDFCCNFFKRVHQVKCLSTETVLSDWPALRETVHECSAETSACKVDCPLLSD